MPDPGEQTIGVAIAVPEPYGLELQRWRESLGDPLARSIPTHITLLPPTPVPTSALGVIQEHLGEAADAVRAFAIHLRGTGTFRPVSPVVFVALAEGIGGCERVERQVRSGPLARPLAFPYHPHVTVAHDISGALLDRAFKELADYEAEFTAHEFWLYEHGTDGVWRPRRAFGFRSGGDPPRRARRSRAA